MRQLLVVCRVPSQCPSLIPGLLAVSKRIETHVKACVIFMAVFLPARRAAMGVDLCWLRRGAWAQRRGGSAQVTPMTRRGGREGGIWGRGASPVLAGEAGPGLEKGWRCRSGRLEGVLGCALSPLLLRPCGTTHPVCPSCLQRSSSSSSSSNQEEEEEEVHHAAAARTQTSSSSLRTSSVYGLSTP